MRTGVLGLLVTAVFLGSTPARAGATVPDAAEAQTLYQKGKAAFETADYDGAVEYWTEAYAALPDGDDMRMIRNDIVYNISTAETKAFDIDGDVRRLKRAKALLDQYLDKFVTESEDQLDEFIEESDRVKARIKELETAIAEVEGGSGPNEPYNDADLGAPAGEKRRMGKMTLAGVILMPSGVIGLGLTIGGALMAASATETYKNVPELRDAATRQNRIGIGLAVTGAVLTAGLVTAGAVLFVKGKKKDRAQAEASAFVVPTVGFGTVGLSGRF